MREYVIFTTYMLSYSGIDVIYPKSIHCNYVNNISIKTDNINIQELKLNFNNVEDFKFLSSNVSSGYTSNNISIIFQIVEKLDDIEPKPISSNWKIFDVTNQISGYTASNPISKEQLTNTIFRIPLNQYESYADYNLNYLNYPSNGQQNALSFGDETYFFGCVTTQIKADVYSTDLSINLPLNEFNSTTNSTWDSVSKVYISEVFIYDENKNLVAVGKMNNPVPKDSSISRTIVFALDF